MTGIELANVVLMKNRQVKNWAGVIAVSLVIVVATVFPAIAAGPSARPAANPKRIALLIGNGQYASTVGPLKNPANDVNLLAAALNAVGFARDNIQVVTNADRVAILAAIDSYAQKIAAAGPEAIGRRRGLGFVHR